MRSKPESESTLPVHALAVQESPVCIRSIEHRNPYDFTREHRHEYFEILFFNEGGGNQLIDFVEYPVVANSCYIVFPRQVHLLRRHENACGLLLQFSEEIIPSTHVKSLLRQLSFGDEAAIMFENDPNAVARFNQMLEMMRDCAERDTPFSKDIVLHYLQAMLLQLMENKRVRNDKSASNDRTVLFDFQHMLDENFSHEHFVQHYLVALRIAEKKLASITKKYLGLSPLQVIHNRLLLEAKRILLFEQVSHKEIAFSLGFDSPASFSQFIRNKTGQTPSELSAQLVNIHK